MGLVFELISVFTFFPDSEWNYFVFNNANVFRDLSSQLAISNY